MHRALKTQPKQVRNAAYRRAVIEGAERVFATQGYEETKVSRIVSEAGLALATVYKLFEGKKAIYQAIHAERLSDLYRVASGALESVSDPRQMLLEGTRAFVRWMVAHPTYLQMNLREGYSWSASTRYGSTSQVEVWQRGIALVSAIFERGSAEGSLVSGDPETQARLLSALQQIYITRWANAEGALSLEALLEELDLQIARTFFTSPLVSEEPLHG